MGESSQISNCIICGSSDCSSEIAPSYKKRVHCKKTGYGFLINEDVLQHDDETLMNKISCLILESLLQRPKPQKSGLWLFDYDSRNPEKSLQDAPHYINLYPDVESFPTDLIERANRTLLNLSVLYPEYNFIITVGSEDMLIANASYSATQNRVGEAMGFLKMMTELGYLKQIDPINFRIPAQGWIKIEELRKKQQEINQGFIAMKFGKDTDYIRDAFIETIGECRYSHKIIDEKQHNNQIVPEIFYEIGRSKFVVVDVTEPNYGAYYEAGYAEALGKEVIVCCSKEAFESTDKEKRPHFDIAQKCMIIWDDTSDLIKRLKDRIEATVGLGLTATNLPQSKE